MAGITAKKLTSVRKALEGVFADDEDTMAQIDKSLDGIAAAIAKGESVTMEDVTDILGDAVVSKALGAVDPAATTTPTDVPIDPIAPIMKGLYEAIFETDGSIRKGVTSASAQGLFDQAYQKALGELDGAIEAAAEATAIELGHGERVTFGKADQQNDKTGRGSRGKAADDDDDGDEDDMAKLLKSLGANPAVIKKIGTLQTKVDQLETERDLERFGKMAVEIGEPEAFGAELLKLHRVDPKLAESVQKRLQAKNAVLQKSRQWGNEIGAGGGDASGTDAYGQLVAKANDLVEKGTKDGRGKAMSFAKAFTEACTRNPDLYAEYQDEQRRKAR